MTDNEERDRIGGRGSNAVQLENNSTWIACPAANVLVTALETALRERCGDSLRERVDCGRPHRP